MPTGWLGFPFANKSCIPVSVSFGSLAVASSFAEIPLFWDFEARQVYGYLRDLVSGTVTAKIKKGSTILATLNWSANGVQSAVLSESFVGETDKIVVEFTSIGVGASNLTITVWGLSPNCN